MPGIGSDLFAQVTNTKLRNPDIKIYVSIGGWAFNDNKWVDSSFLKNL
jgi:GH18 family chitinase